MVKKKLKRALETVREVFTRIKDFFKEKLGYAKDLPFDLTEPEGSRA